MSSYNQDPQSPSRLDQPQRPTPSQSARLPQQTGWTAPSRPMPAQQYQSQSVQRPVQRYQSGSVSTPRPASQAQLAVQPHAQQQPPPVVLPPASPPNRRRPRPILILLALLP